VPLCDRADDRETEARARPPAASSPETVKGPVRLIGLQAAALVADAQYRRPVILARADDDLAARRAEVGRVVYGSTVWVYGNAPAEGTVDEETPLALPAHLYTATKIAGEMYCLSYTHLYALEHTILRFGIPYGPRARLAAVVPAFVDRAQNGKALTIAGDGLQTRQFVYVEDLAEGVVAGLQPVAANRVYNLVGEEETSVREIADTVRKLVAEVPLVHGPERPVDVHIARISGERAATELGWRPTTAFIDGVSRYLGWLSTTSGSPVWDIAASTDGTAAAVLRQEPAEL